MFPEKLAQGPITTGESLLEAAQRQLYEKIGNNVDIWPIGRVPAGSFTSPSSTKLPSSVCSPLFLLLSLSAWVVLIF